MWDKIFCLQFFLHRLSPTHTHTHELAVPFCPFHMTPSISFLASREVQKMKHTVTSCCVCSCERDSARVRERDKWKCVCMTETAEINGLAKKCSSKTKSTFQASQLGSW